MNISHFQLITCALNESHDDAILLYATTTATVAWYVVSKFAVMDAQKQKCGQKRLLVCELD